LLNNINDKKSNPRAYIQIHQLSITVNTMNRR